MLRGLPSHQTAPNFQMTPATGHHADILDTSALYLGYDTETAPSSRPNGG